MHTYLDEHLAFKLVGEKYALNGHKPWGLLRLSGASGVSYGGGGWGCLGLLYGAGPSPLHAGHEALLGCLASDATHSTSL